ncbi:UDP-N-acetylmuramate dehydrogenase [Priestia megaterium]|uniref:UDP-N-acetylmuramate dehydrogenase n=1 Tax=Priestia megaterium TaxID=1404 RepID=UPI0030C91725
MKNYLELRNRIMERVPLENMKFFEPIKNHTYTKVGGKADIFITPSTYEEIQFVLHIAYELNVPVTILGNGSNVIVKDGGIRGITLNLKRFKQISSLNNVITAQSGATLFDVSQKALVNELSGFEFACGIPGTVGGSLYMNAGAYGGQISDVLERALVLTEDGEFLTLSKKDMLLSYRKGIFSERKYIVLEADFRLEQSNYLQIKEKMEELKLAREMKQPLEYPSCGSVFKRPPNQYAGKLIQDAGLQGIRIGGAEVSKKHAGFIINVNEATANDYINLIDHVKKAVKEKFEVELETEVIIIGEEN